MVILLDLADVGVGGAHKITAHINSSLYRASCTAAKTLQTSSQVLSNPEASSSPPPSPDAYKGEATPFFATNPPTRLLLPAVLWGTLPAPPRKGRDWRRPGLPRS